MDIPVYGISKAAVNAYTKLAPRTYPALRVNACSPGFCRTDIAGPNADYSEREPKAPALGADVVVKLLFDDALSQATGNARNALQPCCHFVCANWADYP